MNESHPATYPEERRLATVLFADVEGFTALAEQLDFEEVSDLIGEIWLRLDQVIVDHGGYIDKHIGDGVMALWGVPYAREDDVEHAVEAALAMHKTLADYTAQLPDKRGQNLKIRVGINTGMVLTGYIGLRREYTVMGDTVNVASRLEQQAEAGTVQISDSTYRLVRGAFQMNRMTSFQLKGKTEPTQAYVVTKKLVSPSSVRYRSLGGLKTRFVAREAEVAKLEKRYQDVLSSKKPALVLVVGEAGLGKSRLLMEFSNQLELDEPGVTLVSIRALAQTARVPFYLWKSLWYNHFGLKESDTPAVGREKFLKGVQSLWGQQLGPASALETAHLVGDLCGLSWPDSRFLSALVGQPERRQQRAFELCYELFRRTVGGGMLVLLLDDLHWADFGSLNLLTYLLKHTPEPLPALFLCSGRPDLLYHQPNLEKTGQLIHLTPLPLRTSLMREAYPDLLEFPENVLSELLQRSAGNPYFMEEMVKSLLRSDPVQRGNKILGNTAELVRQLPLSLHAMLQARLDDLTPEGRAVIQLASVVGRVFWVGAIEAAIRGATSTTQALQIPKVAIAARIKTALDELTQVELAFPRAGSVFAGEQQYIFKHALLQEVAYSLLPHKYRRQCHLAVAKWMMSRAGPDYLVIVADHFEKAEEYQRAIYFYEQSIDHALKRGAVEEANWHKAHVHELRSRI